MPTSWARQHAGRFSRSAKLLSWGTALLPQALPLLPARLRPSSDRRAPWRSPTFRRFCRRVFLLLLHSWRTHEPPTENTAFRGLFTSFLACSPRVFMNGLCSSCNPKKAPKLANFRLCENFAICISKINRASRWIAPGRPEEPNPKTQPTFANTRAKSCLCRGEKFSTSRPCRHRRRPCRRRLRPSSRLP
jgi:hypothetical protein